MLLKPLSWLLSPYWLFVSLGSPMNKFFSLKFIFYLLPFARYPSVYINFRLLDTLHLSYAVNCFLLFLYTFAFRESPYYSAIYSRPNISATFLSFGSSKSDLLVNFLAADLRESVVKTREYGLSCITPFLPDSTYNLLLENLNQLQYEKSTQLSNSVTELTSTLYACPDEFQQAVGYLTSHLIGTKYSVESLYVQAYSQHQLSGCWRSNTSPYRSVRSLH